MMQHLEEMIHMPLGIGFQTLVLSAVFKKRKWDL